VDNIAKSRNKKPHFSGFSSLVFGLRGWGGVLSIFRKISSVVGSVFFCLGGFFSPIDKTSENKENFSNKETLKNWVSDFLWHWEDSSMQSHKAAEIIVNYILTFQKAEDQNVPNRLPNPESFFESQE